MEDSLPKKKDEKVNTLIDDAKDAAEDVKDAAEEAADSAADAVNDAAEDAGEALDQAGAAVSGFPGFGRAIRKVEKRNSIGGKLFLQGGKFSFFLFRCPDSFLQILLHGGC